MRTLKEPGAGKPAVAKAAVTKSETKPAKAGKKRKYTWALMVMAAVVLFGGGFLTATVTADPTASDEYIALEGERQQAVREKNSIQGDLTIVESGVKAKEDAVAADAASVGAREKAVKTAEEGIKTKEAESSKKIAEREDAVKKREDAVAGAEQKQAANTIADGTWVVGVDIEPGVYRTKADVGSSCYWAILTSGTNGDDIIANDIPGGGFPTVTLAAGQDFKSSRCGSWTKQ